MSHFHRLSVLAVTAIGVSLLGFTASAEDKAAGKHAGHMVACAKVCMECATECNTCFHHCAELAASGNKEHTATMHLCVDCAEVCSLSGTLSARQSPLAAISCDACAKACDTCAAACEKVSGDDHMKACAKSCRDCAKSCREMVMHLK